MKLIKTDTAVVCHKGCVRGNNEDNFFLNGDYMPLEDMDQGAVIEHGFTGNSQLFAVLDGMGGIKLGERASWIAADMLLETLKELETQEPEDCMKRILPYINRKIQDDCRAHHEDYEGTTLTAVALKDCRVYIFNIGDSRIYRLRGDSLQLMTEDHSTVWENVQQGIMTMEQARRSPDSNMITRYLGMDESDIPTELLDYRQLDFWDGDRYILCSDGLSDMISFDRFSDIARSSRGDPPARCATQLVGIALEEGGKDNVTCMVIDTIEQNPDV